MSWAPGCYSLPKVIVYCCHGPKVNPQLVSQSSDAVDPLWHTLTELNMEWELTAKVALLKLQYFGHVVHGNAGQLALTVLEGTMEGKRYQGKPKRQWLDDASSGRKTTYELKQPTEAARMREWSSAVANPQRERSINEWMNRVTQPQRRSIYCTDLS